MTKLRVITIKECEHWDEIVKSFKNYDVYYLSGYVKAFQLHGDGEPLLFYFDNGNTRAINVVMKRDIAKEDHFIGKIPENTYFDFSTPYGYGGFLIDGDDVEELNTVYKKYCVDNKIVSEFVRFHPIINNSNYIQEMYDVIPLGKTVHIDTRNMDVIWNNLSSKNRNMIRKAQKSNLSVFWGRDEWLIDKFIQLYNATMDRDNASNYYYFSRDFYQSVLNDLKYNAMFFYTKLGDDIISISLILFANNKLNYHLSASKKEYQHLAPTNLLLYEVSCYGANNNYDSLHLGGGFGAITIVFMNLKNPLTKKVRI